MRALVLIGALFGAGYTASIWLAIEHMNSHGSAWNILVVPIALGTILGLFLVGGTLCDALEAGLGDCLFLRERRET